MEQTIIFEIGIVLIFATVLAIISRALRQQLIPAYIIAGVLLGPEIFSIIKDETFIRVLSELGIAFLLFTTGLELDVERIRKSGKSIAFISVFQILITFLLGYYLSISLGFTEITSFYLGFILAFSSTMVVIKLCDEYNQLSTLHGRIVLGVLLIQDIAAVALLSTLFEKHALAIYQIAKPLITAMGFISTALILSKYIFPFLIKRFSRERELLFLFSLSVLFVFSTLSHVLNFSVAVGAFLAGIALASFPYNVEIAGSVRSLRDFFSVIFFVSLGMELKLGVFSSYLSEIVILSIFVILVKPLIVYFSASALKYERKTSFLSGIYLAQTSEFSLIIANSLLLAGIVSHEIFALIVALTLITMSLTPYFIAYGHRIFTSMEKILARLDKTLRIRRREIHEDMIAYIKKLKNHVILCGAHISGKRIIEWLVKKHIPFAVVDFNPEIVETLMKEGVPVIYGDVTHGEVLEYANLKKAKILISTIPDPEDNLFLITFAREINPNVLIICLAETYENAMKYYCAGADYVIIPKCIATEKMCSVIEKVQKNPEILKRMKKEHILFIETQEMKERSAAFDLVSEIKKILSEEKSRKG